MNNPNSIYQKVFDTVPDMIVIAAVHTGLIVDCNPAAVETLGWSREELVGRHQRTLHPPEDVQGEYSRTFVAHAGPENDQTIETQVVTKDGRLLDVAIKASKIEHEGLLLLVGIFRDISEQRAYRRQIMDLARFPDENPNPVLRIARNGNLLYANPAACGVFAMEGLEPGHPIPALLRQELERVWQSGGTEYCEVEVANRFFQFAMIAVGTEYLNAYGQEVTSRKRAELALRRSEEQFRLAQKAAQIGSWDWDVKSGALHWSETVEPLFGLEPGSFPGTYEDFLRLVHPDDRLQVEDAVRAALGSGEDYDIEHRVLLADGNVRWLRESGSVLQSDHYPGPRMLGVVQDVTNQRLLQERIRFVALHDTLTGLYNRYAFEDHLRKALAGARRKGTRLAVLYMDLNGFKRINDRYGHGAGDITLREVACRILACVRESDVVARMGGDEFVGALPDIKDKADVEGVIQRLATAMQQPIALPEAEVQLGMSIGIAVFPDHADRIEELVRLADTAMYQAKQSRTQEFAYCDPELARCQAQPLGADRPPDTTSPGERS